MIIKSLLKHGINFIRAQSFPMITLIVFDISVSLRGFFFCKLFILLFILFFPGMILLGKNRLILNTWMKLCMALCLSLLFIMFNGLVIDIVLPTVFHIVRPLTLKYILADLNIIFICVLVLNRRNAWHPMTNIKRIFSRLKTYDALILSLLIIFITSSICGALILNNEGSNGTAVFAQCDVLVVLILTFVFNKKISTSAYPVIIFCIALGLLYSYSLRGGSHILGWDINEEYRTYLNTLRPARWYVGGLNHDPYNACLSLTILPTIIHSLTNIGGEYLFKVVFPFLFTFVPVCIFLITKKFTKPFYAYLAAILFMAQAEFVSEFPALDRQETAILFAAVTVLTLFSEELSSRTRTALLLSFITGCIISHYSTTYTFLMIIILAFVIERLIKYAKKTIVTKNSLNDSRSYGIASLLIIFSLLAVFLWNLQVTNSTKNVSAAVSGSILNLNSIFGNSSRSDEASSALGLKQAPVTQTQVNSYIKQETISTNNTYKNANKFTSTLLTPSVFSPKSEINGFALFAEHGISLADILIKLSLIVGILALLYRGVKRRTVQNHLITALSLAGVVCLILFAVIPYLSIAYGFGRFYDESLLVLSVPLMIGLALIAGIFGRFKTALMCLICIVYFFTYMGIRYQLLGGIPSLTLNNSGGNYNFYIHTGEQLSANWLYGQNNSRPIYADIYSYLKLESMTPINLGRINTNVLPTTITPGSYVYLRKANLNGVGALRDYSIFHQASVDYTFPNLFLQENKNLIYSNQDSEIYQ